MALIPEEQLSLIIEYVVRQAGNDEFQIAEFLIGKIVANDLAVFQDLNTLQATVLQSRKTELEVQKAAIEQAIIDIDEDLGSFYIEAPPPPPPPPFYFK